MRLYGTLILPTRFFFILLFVYPRTLLIGMSIAVAAALLPSIGAATRIALLGLAIGSVAASFAAQNRMESKRALTEPSGIAVNLRAPFVRRPSRTMTGKRVGDLGDRPRGIQFETEILIHNLSTAGEEFSIELKWNPAVLEAAGAKEVAAGKASLSGKLSPGDVRILRFSFLPIACTPSRSEIEIRCVSRDTAINWVLGLRSVFEGSKAKIESARIGRWKYGMWAAVCWRADIDGLDNLTNETTLTPAFELSSRFKIPISLFVSGRLSLDYEQWASWVKQFPDKFDEGDVSASRFERFALFLRERISGVPLEYPLSDATRVAEVGNHMYLHYRSPYGYDACEENQWRTNQDPGLAPGCITPGDQSQVLNNLIRDLQKNQELIERKLGFRPRTWAAPGNAGHPLMPKALDVVGLVGASEADPTKLPKLPTSVAPYRPDLGAIAPYHPGGTRVVETQAHTRRFDPFTPIHLRCLKKAICRSIHHSTQVTFLVHPHLRLYQPFFGPRSSHPYLREFLRFLVAEKGSLCWVTTHSSLVDYWDRVLCPEHSSISLCVEQRIIRVRNTSAVNLAGIPVDVAISGGRQSTFLVDVPARSSVNIAITPREAGT